MPSTNLTLSDNQVLAEYVPADAFAGLLQNRIGVSPDHAALLIRDGQIVDAFVGGHFAIGGVWQRLKEAVGGPHAVRLLVADLKPFLVVGEVEGLSRDGVKVAGTVAIELQVNPEAPANILGLMPERGPLGKPDVYARVLPHLQERVFRTVLASVDAAEVRGNTGLQDKIQSEVLLEVQRLFRDLGLLVRGVSLTWALNDVERDAIERSAAERAQQVLDYQFACKKREIRREQEATEFQLRADVDLETLKASTEDDLKHLILTQELRFIDARQAGVRGEELKALDHELQVLSVQRRAGYQKALEDAQNDVERAQARRSLAALELEVDAMREEQRLRLARLKEEQELAIAAEARRQQLEAMRGLNAIELDAKERDRRIDREDRLADEEARVRAAQQASLAEVERLRVQAQMSPDQILAIGAGLSPEIAKVFAERARVMSIDVEKREALLKEMVQLTSQGRMASEEQARFFFDKAMQATGAARPEARPEPGPDETTECPGCHRRPPVTDRFCRYCGCPLRA
ncbi:MAG: hypothetical protein H6Q10_2687 [Acidobacteria bacterium]|nr:hypothetical protein [Acidobacteriota bacterium]